MKTSQPRLAPPLARRYLPALCSHFTRKIQVEYTDERGVATFPQGVCELSLDGDVLVLKCRGADDDALASIERVLSLHMRLFTRRDPVTLEWRRDEVEK